MEQFIRNIKENIDCFIVYRGINILLVRIVLCNT